jgi:photosystem II stability/assembly factor-like uncharacterized protein
MSPNSPSSSPAAPELHPWPGGKNRRPRQALLLVLLIIPVVVVWQVLNYRMNNSAPTVAGRPLSNPQTHLHSVAFGGSPHIIYLGTHFGLFISYDGGQTWPQQEGILNSQMILNIAVSPATYRTLAVLGRPYSGFNTSAGIYISSDEGNTWHESNAPAGLPPSAYLFSIQAGSAAAGQFYAFYEFAGWYETRDMGAHWYPITSGVTSNMQTPSLLSDPSDPNHLLLGGDQGLYETHNDGHSWQRIAAVSGNVLGLVASQTAPRLIYCTTDQGIYRWRAGSAQVTQFVHLPMTSYPERIATDAGGNILYAVAGQDLWYSGDGGQSWQHRWHFDRGDMISFLVDGAKPQDLYAGFFSPGQLRVSSDGGRSWQILTQ